MNKIERFRLEVEYNREVYKVLSQRQLPHLVIHNKDGRFIEAKTGVEGLVLLFKTEPLPEGNVMLIVKPNKGLPGIVETIDARLLTQRIHACIRKMFGE